MKPKKEEHTLFLAIKNARIQKDNNNSKQYYKYTVTPGGLQKIFDIITSPSYIPHQKIKTSISLQVSEITYESTLNLNLYTLSDSKYHYSYFLLEKDEPLNSIILINSFSGYYDDNNYLFFIDIDEHSFLSKHLYQIFIHTVKFFHPKMNFIYISNEPIELSKYNTINDLTDLSTYVSLYVRVITKTTLTAFTKNESKTHTGNLFFFDIIDIQNSTLRVVAKNNNASFYYTKINLGKIYEIKGKFNLQKISFYPNVNNDNPIYSLTKEISKPEYEIFLGNDSEVTELHDEGYIASLEKLNFKITYYTISEILAKNRITKIELMSTKGYVKKAGGCTLKTYALRKIVLVDNTKKEINVNLWNQFTLLPIYKGDFICIKNIQVKHKEGINFLTTVDETEIEINPLDDIPKYQMESLIIKPMQNFFTPNPPKPILKKQEPVAKYVINDILNDKFLKTFKIVAYILKIEFYEEVYYEVCCNEGCNQRLKNKGCWLCKKCKQNFFKPHYSFSDAKVDIIDSSGKISTRLAGNQIETLLKLEDEQGIFTLCMEKHEPPKLDIIQKIMNKLCLSKYYYFSLQTDQGNIFIKNIEKIKNKIYHKELLSEIQEKLSLLDDAPLDLNNIDPHILEEI